MFQKSLAATNSGIGLQVKEVSSGDAYRDAGTGSADSDGYVFKIKSSDYAYSQNVDLKNLNIGTDGYGLYLPVKTINEPNGYWLDGNSASWKGRTCYVALGGTIGYSNSDPVISYTLRPVVKIPYSDYENSLEILNALGIK